MDHTAKSQVCADLEDFSYDSRSGQIDASCRNGKADAGGMGAHMVLDLGDDGLLIRAQLHNAGRLQGDLIVMPRVVEVLHIAQARSQSDETSSL